MHKTNKQRPDPFWHPVGTLLTLDRPLLVGYAVFEVFAGTITFGQFTLYTQTIAALQGTLRNLFTVIGQLHEGHLFATNLFKFLSLPPGIESIVSRRGERPISRYPHVSFTNVSFAYPGTSKLVLDQINLSVAPGEVVAVVGKNGSGKSTLVKILSGLYAPTSGEVKLDSINITDLDRRELREHFSVILQDFKIYQFSLRENVGMGRIDEIQNRLRIENALRDTNMESIVQELPLKVETILGRHFNGGHELSGGQRQMVALARSSMRNASIIVMDEPTAALDIYHEREVFEQLLGRRRDSKQSVILISHRMTAVQHADKIIVMDKGAIVEQGSHGELMAMAGLYAEMFNTQRNLYENTETRSSPQ